MATKINYLSIDLKIGGYNLALETDQSVTLADLKTAASDMKNSLMEKVKAGLTFRMEKGKVIKVTVTEIVDWVSEKFGDIDESIGKNMKDFFKEASGATDNITIELWDLSISTKLSFSFCIKVNLTQEFYNAILPEEVLEPLSKIILINSLGFGLSYEKELTTPAAAQSSPVPIKATKKAQKRLR